MITGAQELVRYGVQLTLLFALFASFSAHATPTWHTAKINSIYPLADGAFILQLDNDSSACTSGSSPDFYYVRVGQNAITQEALNNMLSVALAAASLRINVSINFDSSGTACYVNRLSANFAS